MKKLLNIISLIFCLSLLNSAVFAQSGKEELERKAWNLVRDSAYAQDFRNFLREFPDGKFAAGAKIRLEQAVWNSVKSSNDAAKVKAYLDEFPTGINASSGRILYRYLTGPKNQLTTKANTRSNTNSNSVAMPKDKENLYIKFVSCYKSPDVKQRDLCYEVVAKEFLNKYEKDKDEYTTFVRKKYDQYIGKLDRPNPLIERFNNPFRDPNDIDYEEVFAVGREIIRNIPDLIDVPIVLASIGFENAAARKPNDKYNAEAISYAKIVIQQLEAGKTSNNYGANAWTYKTKEFPDGKSNTLGWMNYTIGYIMYNRLNQKKEALPYLYKATTFNSETKRNPAIYHDIGKWYVDEFVKLDADRIAKIKAAGDKDTEETLKILALQKGYVERAIDAFARAYKVAGNDWKTSATKNALLKRAKELYEILFNKDMRGFDDYFKTITDKPFSLEN